jgi:protein arginine N-methyltransferase 1
MYRVADYGRMIRDWARTEAYAQALEQAVRPSTVVADIGAGTGIFTVLACRLGARRVYAIEPTEALNVLREVVAENGFTDRVEFLRAFSTEITLPERADVVLSDLRGSLPFFEHSVAAVIDARERHLAPGGTLIAARDFLQVAVGSLPEYHERIVGPWFDARKASFEAARRYAANSVYTPGRDKLQLLTPAATWFELDYRTVVDPRGAGTARLSVEKPGFGHGLIQWFDCETIPGHGFSNAPGANPDSVYEQRFFPWPEAVALEPGDVAEVEIHADPVGDDYVWRWDTTVRDAAGHVRKEFRQSTFFSSPIAAETLSLRAAGHRPALNEDGAIERFLLERMDGSQTLEAIAAALCERFPHRFRDRRAALRLAGDLSVRYSRTGARGEAL